jgi:hypothetical protein
MLFNDSVLCIHINTHYYGNALCIISLYTTNNCAKIFLGDQPMGSCPNNGHGNGFKFVTFWLQIETAGSPTRFYHFY